MHTPGDHSGRVCRFASGYSGTEIDWAHVSAVRVRSCKYLNNVVEQDHRRLKQRIGPMLGFKRLDMAAITIRGIELAEKIKKAQFQIGKLPISFATAPVVWAALLAL